MIINVEKLPKKLNEFNYFKKEEKGCTLFSYGIKSSLIIVVDFSELEIEKDFCVDNKSLEMLKLLSPCEIEVENNNFIIKSKKGKYKSKLVENSTFVSPNLEFENQCNTNFERLKIASCFVSKSESRPILTGVHIDLNGGIEATDSFTAFRVVNNEFNKVECDLDKSIVIPSQFIDYIAKNLYTEDKDITIYFNEKSCMIRTETSMFIHRLIAGKYPDLSRIFNNIKSNKTLRFYREELKEKITISKNLGVKMSNSNICVTFENGRLIAEGENDFDCELLNLNNDNDYQFTLALEKLDVVIENLTNTEINIGYTGALYSLLFKDRDYEILLQPIRKM